MRERPRLPVRTRGYLLLALALAGCDRSTTSFAAEIVMEEGCTVRFAGEVYRGGAEDVGLMTIGQSSEGAQRQRINCLGPGFDFAVEFPEVPITEAIEFQPVLPAGSYSLVSPETSLEELSERDAQVVFRLLGEGPEEPEQRWESVEGKVGVEMLDVDRYRLRLDGRLRN